jgi:hypothetical protein
MEDDKTILCDLLDDLKFQLDQIKSFVLEYEEYLAPESLDKLVSVGNLLCNVGIETMHYYQNCEI